MNAGSAPAAMSASTPRIETWARLWLSFIVSVLLEACGAPPQAWRDWLSQALTALEGHVRQQILVRAAAGLSRRGRPAPAHVRTLECDLLRPALGGAVRRAMKGRGYAARAVALLRALRDIAILARRVRRRLIRGLTRLHGALSLVFARPLAAHPSHRDAPCSAAFSDTS